MECQYTVRVNKDNPVALCRNGKIILGFDALYDREAWIADRPESQAVTVAVDWFQQQVRNKTKLRDVTQSRRWDIKAAKKNGATIGSIKRNYNLNISVIKDILRG
jgi:hypothetical protein